MSAKLIQAIEAEESRGSGTRSDRHRIVRRYYSPDGALLAELDPCPALTNLQAAVIAWVDQQEELRGITEYKGPFTGATDTLLKLAVKLRAEFGQ